MKKQGKKGIKKVSRTIRIALLFVIALLFAVIFVLPTVITISNSFMTQSEINANYGKVFETTDHGGKAYIAKQVNIKIIPDMVSFQQYSTVLLKSPKYLFKFWNSVIYTVPIMIFQLIVAVLASYAFTRFKGRLKELLFFLYIIVVLMPYQVTLVPNFLVSEWLGIYDTRWAVWLPGIFSPFSVYLLTKYMKRIPSGIIEAAKIDGAGEWQIFRHISLPLCKGALYSIAILVFIDFWNMVEQPLILLADEELHPLSIFLSKINSDPVLQIGAACGIVGIVGCQNAGQLKAQLEGFISIGRAKVSSVQTAAENQLVVGNRDRTTFGVAGVVRGASVTQPICGKIIGVGLSGNHIVDAIGDGHIVQIHRFCDFRFRRKAHIAAVIRHTVTREYLLAVFQYRKCAVLFQRQADRSVVLSQTEIPCG